MRTIGMGPIDVVWLGSGGWVRILEILAGVLVHRATRPLRGSVSCVSGWLALFNCPHKKFISIEVFN